MKRLAVVVLWFALCRSVPAQTNDVDLGALLDTAQIGMSISPGFAPEPEQSTLAIIAHHPDATYFGMKSGTLPKTDRQRADDVIAGSDRDPSLFADLPDEDPDDGQADEQIAGAASV